MRWINEAKKLIGTEEFPGGKHNPVITQMWKDIKRGGIKDDETPWCAAFVGACLERSGIKSTRFESAKSYLDWGIPLDGPVEGCVVVFNRKGGGHVGFVVGMDKNKNLQVLGGNQGDMVRISSFISSGPDSRVAGYRWPEGEPMPKTPMPIYENGAPISTKEA